MKSLADLRAIKEKALNNIQSRTNQNTKYTISICMGTCGIAAGARDVLKSVMEEIKERKLISEIDVVQTGCAGFCTNEPMLEIKDSNGNQIMYQKMNQEKVKRIFDEHITKNVVVSDYVFDVSQG